MQTAIREAVLEARSSLSLEELAEVVATTEADTIYRIDRVGEEAILAWLDAHWPAEFPAELVMEGLEERVVVPRSGAAVEARLTCIIDPIDGTRCLMHDKRSAWVLSAVAPYLGGAGSGSAGGATLADIVVAVMTELPPVKQRRADQISAIAGAGRRGLRAERVDLDSGCCEALPLRASRATDLMHGFASFARFFSAGKVLMAEFEAALLERLYGDTPGWPDSATIFDDQYLCTGGQFYELLVGHDRMLGDLRPLALAKLGASQAICCHPYDACTALILQEAGCPIAKPNGQPLDAPLDTSTSVAWVGFANATLLSHVRPALEATLREFFGDSATDRGPSGAG